MCISPFFSEYHVDEKRKEKEEDDKDKKKY